MKNHMNREVMGFTLIELLIVIAIIGILAGTAMPAYNSIRSTARRTTDASNIKQIITGCQTFATDNGAYPSYDPEQEGEDASFSKSFEAFNVLLKEGVIDIEKVFWIQTNHPDKLRPPKEDGELESRECVYGYTTGLTESSYSYCPLVYDGLMEGPGQMGEYHPWLEKRKAVVGFCDGHVETLSLTGKTAGATIRSQDRSIDDIFQTRQQSDDGKSSGGYLTVPQENVLLPD